MLYRYDAIGSAERVKAFCSGKGEKRTIISIKCYILYITYEHFSGEQLIQPFLDEITNMEEDPRY